MHPAKKNTPHISIADVVAVPLVLVAFMLTLTGDFSANSAFVSSEVRFAEESSGGMQIIPASCPSSPHYSGECSQNPPTDPGGTNDLDGTNSNSCELRYYCSGDTLYYGDVRFSFCQNDVSQVCAFGCSGSACLPPPPTSSALSLTARPSIVPLDETTVVTWTSADTISCVVTSDGGDSWSGINGSRTSLPITHQTTFSLRCNTTSGSVIATTTVVNLVPFWQER